MYTFSKSENVKEELKTQVELKKSLTHSLEEETRRNSELEKDITRKGLHFQIIHS